MPGAFQTVFDNAQSISIHRRKKVAQSQARDGTIKSTSLGGQTWQFEVKLPDGPRWTDYRGAIEQMEALDRTTVSTVQISNTGQSWLSKYQGNLTNVSAITVTHSGTNVLTITGGAGGLTLGQYRFRAGDFIQLGSTGSVYSVVNDVVYNNNTITVHRPIRENTGTYTLIVGQAVTWNIICVNFPKWTIFDYNQVSWDGPFVFAEAI